MASGGQGAAPLAGLVDGRHVRHPLGDVLPLHGLQPHLTEREERGEGAVTEGADREKRTHVCLLFLLCHLEGILLSKYLTRGIIQLASGIQYASADEQPS